MTLDKSFFFKAFTIIFGLTVLFFILNCIAVSVPLGHYKRHIMVAFHRGDLIPKAHAGFDSVRGDTQYEDCLLIQQGLKLSPSFMHNVLNSPKYGDRTKCISLREVVFGAPIAEKKGLDYYTFINELSERNIKTFGHPDPYYQYIHGARALTVASLSIFQLRTLRFLYQKLDYFLVFFISLVVAVSTHLSKERRIVFSTVFFIVFSFFHGIDFFGTSLVHGPGDWLAFGTFLFLLRFLKRKKYSQYLLTLLISGGCTAYIEKLVGILPAITCLIPISTLLYYACGDLDKKTMGKLIIYGVSIFAFGFIFTYFAFMALKIYLMAWAPSLFPDQTNFIWIDLLHHFGLRVGRTVNENPITYMMVIKMLWSRMFWIAGSVHHFAQGIFTLGTLGIFGIGLWNLFKPKRIEGNKDYRMITGVALLPYLFTSVWFYVFQNHAFIHPWFMVRLLSYPLFAGWFIIASFATDWYLSRKRS